MGIGSGPAALLSMPFTPLLATWKRWVHRYFSFWIVVITNAVCLVAGKMEGREKGSGVSNFMFMLFLSFLEMEGEGNDIKRRENDFCCSRFLRKMK